MSNPPDTAAVGFTEADLDKFTLSVHSWSETVDALTAFDHHTISFDDGLFRREGWVFRGVSDSAYHLEPAIERLEGLKFGWATAEYRLLSSFKERARLHLDGRDLPPDADDLGWLAAMQHHGVPTRLLDFTLSPWVALYFAVRRPLYACSADRVAVWAIDQGELSDRARIVDVQARANERTIHAAPGKPISFHPDTFGAELDSFRYEAEYINQIPSDALAAPPERRIVYRRSGFVIPALPPTQNRRLSSQQGVFLLNGADELTFESSLKLMMAEQPEMSWIRRYVIPVSLINQIEKELHRMNIHELSLFPDISGLAGFLLQEIRLNR